MSSKIQASSTEHSVAVSSKACHANFSKLSASSYGGKVVRLRRGGTAVDRLRS